MNFFVVGRALHLSQLERRWKHSFRWLYRWCYSSLGCWSLLGITSCRTNLGCLFYSNFWVTLIYGKYPDSMFVWISKFWIHLLGIMCLGRLFILAVCINVIWASPHIVACVENLLDEYAWGLQHLSTRMIMCVCLSIPCFWNFRIWELYVSLLKRT